jgi:hypothetical protein
MRKNSRISWSYQQVKGHQDDLEQDLDIWAQQNITMEKRAKEHLLIACRAPRHHNITGETWQLWVDEKKITSNIQSNIYSSTHQSLSESYWSRKENNLAGIQEVD